MLFIINYHTKQKGSRSARAAARAFAERSTVNKKSTALKVTVGIVFVCLFFLMLVFLFWGENATLTKALFTGDISGEEYQERISSFHLTDYLIVAFLAMLQVVFTFLPAEPVQVIAGISFGFVNGILCCFIGVFLGSTVIYLLYKIYGERLGVYFNKNLNIDFEGASTSGRVALVIFVLYCLPAIPYGLICFFACTCQIKYPRYIFLTTLGALPSVCLGVGLGHVSVAYSWAISLAVFIVLVTLLLLLFRYREPLFAWVNRLLAKEKKLYSSKTTVREYSRHLLTPLYLGSRILFFGRLKFRVKATVPVPEKPCIVLVNHGSFNDFAFAGTMLRRHSPNFIVARLYFYHKWLGRLLKRLGCFPKGMFTSDAESAMNCLRVLKRGGMLAMMPEARLSTAGTFEDIQPATYSFLKSAGVPVYVLHLNGSYLAKPKWGKGIRRGSLVEGEMRLLFEGEEVKALDVDTIKLRVDEALYYDELAWLETHPELRYRSRKMAEGLENILTLCPSCGAHCSIVTKRRTVRCSSCGLTCRIDSRYAFEGGKPFENFAVWYEWQVGEMRQRMLSDPDFALESPVKLMHASVGGKGMLRPAGEGTCRLSREGLLYEGTEDGKAVTRVWPLDSIYRLLFGAGEDFELYEGKEIYYFVPEEKRSCVDWYIASTLLRQEAEQKTGVTL